MHRPTFCTEISLNREQTCRRHIQPTKLRAPLDYSPASSPPGESDMAHPNLSGRPRWYRWAPPPLTRWCPPAGGTTQFAPAPSAGPTWRTPACSQCWEPGLVGVREVNFELPHSLLGQPLLCSPHLFPVFPHFYLTSFFSSLSIQKQTERGKREKKTWSHHLETSIFSFNVFH